MATKKKATARQQFTKAATNAASRRMLGGAGMAKKTTTNVGHTRAKTTLNPTKKKMTLGTGSSRARTKTIK